MQSSPVLTAFVVRHMQNCEYPLIKLLRHTISNDIADERQINAEYVCESKVSALQGSSPRGPI